MPPLLHTFRAYDIRGIVPQEFSPEVVFRLGSSLGTYFDRHDVDEVVIGRDCRESSPEFAELLHSAVRATGRKTVDIGMVPTPALYYAVKAGGYRGGVMITASHNPPQYNGFKIWCSDTTIFGQAIQDIYDIFALGVFSAGVGSTTRRDIMPDYEAAVCAHLRAHRPIKVVVDGGNGVGGEALTRILTRMGAEVTPLYCTPDGTFPNHHPDPVIAENMRDLIAAVGERGAELGVGLDGDGDRLCVVDAAGRMLAGDELLSIYAQELLRRQPGAMIFGDVKCSDRLFSAIQAQGGDGRMCVTGHSLAKAYMRETGAPLGGELSGHMFFNDGWIGVDDALYGAARLVDILTRPDTPPLTALPGWPPAAVTPEVQLPCPEMVKAQVIRLAQEYYPPRYPSVTLDGVRVRFLHGWGLVRASNTQPVLILRFEADTDAHLAEIQEEMCNRVQAWLNECTAAMPQDNHEH